MDLPFDGTVTFGYSEAPVKVTRMLAKDIEIREMAHQDREWRIHPGQGWRPGMLKQAPKGIFRWPDSCTGALAMPHKLCRPCS